MKKRIRLLRSELDYSLGSVAWMIYHGHPELNDHVRHQIADVCQGENRHSVSRLLLLGIGELCRKMGAKVRFISGLEEAGEVADKLIEPTEYLIEIEYAGIEGPDMKLLAEQMHFYLVWRVMRDWLAPWLPSGGNLAEERVTEYLAKVSELLGKTSHCRRRLPPIA